MDAQKKILVVDDDEEFLDEISGVLGMSGYNAVTLSQGEQTIAQARSERPDVILLDMKMEGVTGFETAGKLKNTKDTKHIPIIAITGFYTDREHQLYMRVCGIDKCLLKPVHPLEVISAIENVI